MNDNVSMKRRISSHFLLSIMMLFFSITIFAQNTTLFEQGKEQYKNGKYQEAILSWMKILESGETSAELYFNLGNSQYKLNQIGPSIYYYEKALQLSPNDNDIKNNLAFAENARIDVIEPLPESVFRKWFRSIAENFTFDGWAILTVGCSIGFVGLFLSYYFSYSEKTKRLLFASSILVGFFFIATLSMAFITHKDSSKKHPAIIFSNQLQVKTEPSMGSNSAFVLHEGTKVQITAQDGNWFRIMLADGKDGWVPASDLKQL